MGIDDIRGNFVNFYENGLKPGVCVAMLTVKQ